MLASAHVRLLLSVVVDDTLSVESMNTVAADQHPAQRVGSPGSSPCGRPSMGACSTYGLGSEATNLPGFVVFSAGAKE